MPSLTFAQSETVKLTMPPVTTGPPSHDDGWIRAAAALWITALGPLLDLTCLLLSWPTYVEGVLREWRRVAEMANTSAKAPVVATAVLDRLDHADMRLRSSRLIRSDPLRR